jgi:hypothetical protein
MRDHNMQTTNTPWYIERGLTVHFFENLSQNRKFLTRGFIMINHDH